MPTILITPAAESDLINLWVFITQDNKVAADKVYEAAEQTFATLASMPAMGTLYQPKRRRLEGIRFFPVTHFQKYIIYYRVIQGGIEIIRVVHAHMERQKRLEQGH